MRRAPSAGGGAGFSSARAAAQAVAVPIALILAYGVARVLAQAFGEVRDAIFAPVSQRAIRNLALEVFQPHRRRHLPVPCADPEPGRGSALRIKVHNQHTRTRLDQGRELVVHDRIENDAGFPVDGLNESLHLLTAADQRVVVQQVYV